MIIGKSREDSNLNDFLGVGRFLVAFLPLTGHGNFGSSAVFFFYRDHWGIEGKRVSQYCVQGEQSQRFRCIEIVYPLTSVVTAERKINSKPKSKRVDGLSQGTADRTKLRSHNSAPL